MKTELSPNLSFSVDKINITSNKNELLDINKFGIDLSLSEILKKKIILKSANVDSIYADVSKIIELPAFKNQNTQTVQSDWNFDIFRSVLLLKQAKIVYAIDKNTIVNIDAKDVKIDDNISKKHVYYNVVTDIVKGKNTLHILTSDGGKVYIKNKENLIIDNSEIFVNGNKILLKANVDAKSNFDVNLVSKNFSIPYVIDLLNSQIVENDLQETLSYFKDIQGDFDFDIKADNKNLDGKIILNKLSFKLIPFMDLPVLLDKGRVTFDNDKVFLKGFEGYYNGKPSNKMDFEGTVKDYLKSVDTDLVGNAIVTDDFTRNYMSKMFNTNIGMEGQADTRVKLKSKYNKIDLTWLYRFKKGNGFIFDGEESTMNDLANRVLVAKMTFENTLLAIKSIDYYAGNPDKKTADARIPIVSFNSNIDFANGQTFVKDFELKLPKPMPSGFINMLTKQKLFKNGTFTGQMKVINTGKYPVLYGNMKIDKVGIPSQRLFIRSGEMKAEKGFITFNSEGRFRRSKYNAFAKLVNEIRFPIIVKDAELGVDCIDVERYLQLFNNQNPSDSPSQDVQAAVAKSVETNTVDDVDSDDLEQTFDIANLIIEKCLLKADKGFYKDINFANVEGNLTLDRNSVLKLESNKFDIAEGTSSAKINCDLKNHKYSIWLALVKVNADIIASTLLNLPKEIDGRASGLMELETDDSLKLNGRIQFRIYEGIIAKIGLVEYAMKVASLFRNPLTMITPTIITDLVSIPEGKFNQIDGDLKLKDNVVQPMIIKSSSPQLASFIVGTYDLESQDAALRIYTKFSNRKKGVYGFLRNLSLNSLANRIPLSSRNDSDYYSAEISQIPEIEAEEKDCQIFLTKVDGDIVQNNFLSSLKKIK
ncbi:AsmA-like C-terminal region-containing protein [bacterium]|nr:AsmA-like C-terminal region-containing protein [bacterium]